MTMMMNILWWVYTKIQAFYKNKYKLAIVLDSAIDDYLKTSLVQYRY